MTEPTRELAVMLAGQPVGSLTLDKRGGVEMRWLSTYINGFPRPVLGQHFLDDPGGVYRSQQRVPPWFSNLLPEGLLRELVARQANVGIQQEFGLLGFLGADLAGAVQILPLSDSAQAEVQVQAPAESPADPAWHFSLAGVQLKFSANRLGKGLTVRASGQGGDWIVKLPSRQFAQVPMNEFATSNWARDSGIDVPETALIRLVDIDGVSPSLLASAEEMAFAIRRFDRPESGKRVHMEDFAQVINLYPEQKYDHCNFETLAKIVQGVVGDEGLRSLLRRLVFMVASGNGDAHLKNWSLLYIDPQKPVLSPAYDLVSTIQYMPDDRMALNLARSKHWADVTTESFTRLARKIGVAETTVLDSVREAVALVRQSWGQHAADFGYSVHQQQVIERHMQTVPLLR